MAIIKICPTCNGEQQILTINQVDSWDGQVASTHRCPKCNGTGILNDADVCTKCNGGKKIVIKIGEIETEKDCDHCYGSGKRCDELAAAGIL